MNLFRKIVCIAFGSLPFWACDPCKNLDCRYSDFSGKFRFLDNTATKDMVFGSPATLDRQKIKFYALNNRDTINYPWQPAKDFASGDSVLLVNFFPKTDTAYIRYSDTDTDTLVMKFASYASRCCGTVTEITAFTLNGGLTLPGKNDVQKISK